MYEGLFIFYENMEEIIHLLLALIRRNKGEGERAASEKGWGYMECWGG